MKKLLALVLAAVFSTGAYAQFDDDDEDFLPSEPSISFNGGTDIASAYLWRGQVLLNSANFQPYLTFNAGIFSVGLWNMTDFSGKFKEFDMYMSLTAGQVTFTVTDYYSQYGLDDPNAEQPVFGDWYAHSTAHSLEFSTDWESEFGLDASANVIFYGADKRDWEEDEDEAMKNAYSTYLELGYTATVKEVDFRPFVGMTFGRTTWYGDCSGEHEGPNVVNLGFSVSHEIKITDKFSLPVYATFGYNPQLNDAAALAGFTIGF